jgi:hypothetical protein
MLSACKSRRMGSVFELLTSSAISTEAITDLRNDFRHAFQSYLYEGERMAKLLRTNGDDGSPDRRSALREQQTNLTAALRKYESARQRYVEAVMGQVAGLSAMGLKIQ